MLVALHYGMVQGDLRVITFHPDSSWDHEAHSNMLCKGSPYGNASRINAEINHAEQVFAD